MADDVNDPSGLSTRTRNQIAKLDEIDNDADREHLRSWANDMLTSDLATTTVTNRLNPVRMTAERADSPLVEFDSKDRVLDLLSEFADGTNPDVKDDGLGDGTIRQYRQALKLFFRDKLGHEWADDIVIGGTDPTPITEDQILTDDDVDALLDTSENPRDTALVAFLCVTGQRITAALSIRVGDVNLAGQTGTITLNSEATGMKGASGPRPILWARPFIATWLSNHPDRDDDDAPLFCATQSGRRPTEDGGWVTWEAGDTLSPSQARGRLTNLAEKAGVNLDKVKPHNFRHTAITRMRDEGVSDDRIRFMVGVDEESTILERYDKQSDERMLARIRNDYGMDVEDPDRDVGKPTMDNCPYCHAPLRESARFCDACGAPLDAGSAEMKSETRDGLADIMEDSNDPDRRSIARDAMDEVDVDPALVEAVADELESRGHD